MKFDKVDCYSTYKILEILPEHVCFYIRCQQTFHPHIPFRAEESDSKKFKELPKLASNLEAELHLEPLSPS